MELKQKIFAQLYYAQGTDVSGEGLAEKLGVSRAAVWKGIKALKEEGFTILSSTNRGYRLVIAEDACDERTLCARLNMPVIKKKSLPSTNEFALSIETDKPMVVIADEQTSGKARHGGIFPSPAERGVYFSCLIFPVLPLSEAEELTKAAVRVVAEAIGGTAKEQEVFLSGIKTAGVLTELRADTDRIEKAAVGVGVYTDGILVDRRQLIECVVKELQKF